MFDYNKKRKIRRTESILDTEKYMFREDDAPEEKPQEGFRVDYIRLPGSQHGLASVICAGIALVFTVLCFGLLWRAEGEPRPLAAAFVACSVLWALAGIVYGIFGRLEKNRNYTTAWLGIAVSGLLLVLWGITAGISARL